MPQSAERLRQYRKQYHDLNKTRVNARARANGRKVAGRYSRCRSSARERGLLFDLTIEQYAVLVGRGCHYCSGPLPEAGSGLDRKDNTRGYTHDNVVPCCRHCNTIKSDKFTEAEMRVIGRAIKKVYAARKRG